MMRLILFLAGIVLVVAPAGLAADDCKLCVTQTWGGGVECQAPRHPAEGAGFRNCVVIDAGDPENGCSVSEPCTTETGSGGGDDWCWPWDLCYADNNDPCGWSSAGCPAYCSSCN